MTEDTQPTTTLHPVARSGFARGAEAYERGRPEYPSEAINYLSAVLGLRPGTVVADVGAGTGKLTRMLLPTGARVIAVEPVAEMRARLRTVLSEIEILDATAESLPFGDGSLDAVVAGQAFHWFASTAAVAQFHRVLRPGGRLGLLWNVRDESEGLAAEIAAIIRRYEKGVPRYHAGEWKSAFAGARFTPLELKQFSQTQRLTTESLIDRVLSTSFIAALADSDKAAIAGEIRDLVGANAATAGKDEVELKYRTDVYWCEKQ